MSTFPMKNDPYGLLASGLPPEIAAQARGLSREQQIAEALMQQSMQPLGGARSAGRYMVAPHPMEGIAKIVQAIAGRKGLNAADEKFGELGKKYQSGVANAMMNYQQQKVGRPPQLDPQEVEQSADQGTPLPGNVGADPRGALMQAMMNPYLKNNPMIAEDMKQMRPTALGRSMVIPATGETVARDETWQQEQEAARADRAATAEASRTAAMERLREQIAAREAAGQQAAELRRELAQMQADARREIAGMQIQGRRDLANVAASLRQPPAPVPVTIQDPNNPNATLVIDGRTRQPFGAGPKLTEAGKMDAKRTFNMQGIGEIISEAERLLTDPSNQPTGSGAGALWDKAAGFVGVTPKGAKEAQELKAVGAALVSKMPRMEGPQSDKDVQLYRESAAEVGDPTVPVERRKAALGRVKQLWSKYERPGAASPRVIDFNSLPPGQ